MADERFWPDHTVRCQDCGRELPYADARNDNWRDSLDRVLPVHLDAPGVEYAMNITGIDPKAPIKVQGRCWRCARERRAV